MDSGESFCDLCTRLGLHDTPLIDIIEEIDRLRTFIAEAVAIHHWKRNNL
jgi:hypothetical protein